MALQAFVLFWQGSQTFAVAYVLHFDSDSIVNSSSDNLNSPENKNEKLDTPKHILHNIGRNIEDPATSQYKIKHNTYIVSTFPKSNPVPEQKILRFPMQKVPVIADIVEVGEDCCHNCEDDPGNED